MIDFKASYFLCKLIYLLPKKIDTRYFILMISNTSNYTLEVILTHTTIRLNDVAHELNITWFFKHPNLCSSPQIFSTFDLLVLDGFVKQHLSSFLTLQISCHIRLILCPENGRNNL